MLMSVHHAGHCRHRVGTGQQRRIEHAEDHRHMGDDQEQRHEAGVQAEPRFRAAALQDQPEIDQRDAAERDDPGQVEADRDDVGRAAPGAAAGQRHHRGDEEIEEDAEEIDAGDRAGDPADLPHRVHFLQ